MKRGKVLVAMSGGVDSSVAAYLLQSSGWDVVGAHLELWNDGSGEGEALGALPRSPKGDAEAVCRRLGIPFHRFDLKKEFKARVVDYFCREYLAARTPNPCVRCNKLIKFGLLKETAEKMGIPFLATGHYARIEEEARYSGFVLKRAMDPKKDQSYALFALDRGALSRILLPMGSITKERAREIAREEDLGVADTPESQDICFIPGGDYAGFITERFPDRLRKGPVKNRSEEELGTHEGLYRYTVGQRRGIGVAAKKPYYVLQLRPSDNALVVGSEEETYRDRFEVKEVNWLVPPQKESFETEVKIRYSSRAHPGEVEPLPGDRARVRSRDPQKAVTPGQAAVFYEGDVVLGGGWIV